MKSILATYKAAQDHDYLLRGAFFGSNTGIFDHITDAMPLFWSPPFEPETPSPTIVSIELKRIAITGKTLTVLNTQSIATDRILLSTTFSRWESDTSKTIGSQTPGTYLITFEDSTGREYHTAPFHISSGCSGASTLFPIFTVKTNSPAAPVPILTVITNAD